MYTHTYIHTILREWGWRIPICWPALNVGGVGWPHIQGHGMLLYTCFEKDMLGFTSKYSL